MANFPVQVILDSDRYIQEVLPHPGGAAKIFTVARMNYFLRTKKK